MHFQTTTKGEERTTTTLSLFSLSLSLEEEEEAFCERALLVCVVPDRCVLRLSLFVTLNSNTLNQWVLKSARDTFLVTPSRPRRAEADRKSPEKDDDVNDDDDNNAKNDSRKSEAFALLLPPATSRGGGVPPSVFFFVVVATRNASH